MAERKAHNSSLLIDLADDVLDIIGMSLSPTDICNTTMSCKRLNSPTTFDKSWYTHCEELGVLSSTDLVEWRKVMLSYKALYRFLKCVKPLVGIWVCQNPEQGNVVYVMPGFASVVGCRIIPQRVGPLSIEGSPILWTPVFEVISDEDGAQVFVLHGREKNQDYIYPGKVESIDKHCNALFLEVWNNWSSEGVSFSKLSFKDQKKLIEIVTVGVRGLDQTCGLLFPCVRGDEDKFEKDVALLSERREMLMKNFKLGGGYMDWTDTYRQQIQPDEIDISENEDSDLGDSEIDDSSIPEDSDSRSRSILDKFSRFWRKMRSCGKVAHEQQALLEVSENKEAKIDEFISSGDKAGLILKASHERIPIYKTWPHLNNEVFALLKHPVQLPTIDQEYAGLWGGTFGWPPEKPGRALFFVNISYHEKSGKTKILATTILQGGARHPNGSTMFTVYVNKPSTESFPWDSVIKQGFMGKGITSGYGFRYPSSKPGSLFELEDGMLAFVWEESGTVLTLQRLDLDELLKKGQRVPPLSPVDNFAYLERSYSNVFVDKQT